MKPPAPGSPEFLVIAKLETLPDKLLPLKPYLQIIDVIALENNMSKNQLALSFVLQNNLIDNVLIGVDSIEQLRENLNGIVYINEKTIKQIHSINLDKPDLLNPSNWN